jgi:hypothetical protein|tara:strand:- start:1118 stop:1303 length:186 start_codon:yes stop_codon:yes gene_type:complete
MKPDVIITESSVTITHNNEEIVHWVSDEWEEDPSIVPSITNAIKLAYTDVVHLRELVGKPL